MHTRLAKLDRAEGGGEGGVKSRCRNMDVRQLQQLDHTRPTPSFMYTYISENFKQPYVKSQTHWHHGLQTSFSLYNLCKCEAPRHTNTQAGTKALSLLFVDCLNITLLGYSRLSEVIILWHQIGKTNAMALKCPVLHCSQCGGASIKSLQRREFRCRSHGDSWLDCCSQQAIFLK